MGDNCADFCISPVLAALDALYRIGESYMPLSSQDAHFLRSRLAWVAAPPGYRLSLGPSGVVVVYPCYAGWDVYLCGKRDINRVFSSSSVEEAHKTAEKYARANWEIFFMERASKWRRDPASEGQLRFLTSMGLAYFPGISKGDAE